MIGSNNISFRSTLQNFFKGSGNFRTLNALLSLPEIRCLVATENKEALKGTTENDHLAVINRLLEIPAAVDVIAANNNEALQSAALNGQLTIVNRLLEFPAVVNTITAGNNGVLQSAALGGELAVVNRLLEYPEVVAAIAANNNWALKLAAQYGRLAVINRLLEFPAVISDITDNNEALTSLWASTALELATQHGHLAVVNRLLELPAVADAIAADNNKILRCALRGGHLAITNRLLEFPKVVAAITANSHAALMAAIMSGHLTVVNRLLEFPAVVEVIAAEDNEALREAASNGNLDIANHLLEFPAVVDTITADNNGALRLAARNDNLDIVNRLLEYPEVVAAATANRNEALRDALHSEYHEVAARLRQIPAVAAYEIAHPDFDEEEDDEEDDEESDLIAIAQDEESAIRRLSSTESEELSTLKKRYATQFQQQGLENILSFLRKYLIAKYQECPARYQDQTLPLDFNDKLDKEAIGEYYKNPFHTAFRYLFCQPNPWMAPDAYWVSRDALGRLSANISDNTKENIAYLWLAVSDPALPLPAGFTQNDIQNRFVDLLADAGRGHNWDKTRIKTILKNNELVEKEEAYDDGEGDKPSCSLGVTRRTVAQFLLLLQPEVKPLNGDAIYLQFKESLVTENSHKNGLFDKIMALDINKLKDLKSSLRNFVLNAMKMNGLSEAERGLLQTLSIDAKALKSFMDACYQNFGERLGAKSNPKWQGESFDSYAALIQYFAQNPLTVFYNELAKKCDEQLHVLVPKETAEPESSKTPAPVVIPSATVGPAPILYSSKKRQLEPKKSRQKPLSEVQSLLEPFLESGIRRSPRLIAKARQAQELTSEAPLMGKRRCRKK